MISTVKLTIVVSVFNVESYLEETLLCIENQTIGMKNMEIILINDGSSDTSAEICYDFQKKYTENVQYVELLGNQGISHAKNIALDMAKGVYITFWDADNLWSLNAMEEAVAFLESHEKEIDMVFCNIEYFDSYARAHVLNFDIKKDMIIDILKEYQKIQISGASCVMKTEVAKHFCYDESQRCWEDTKYINQLLLQKKKYGMLSNVLFYYRCHQNNDSVTRLDCSDKHYYLYDLGSFFKGIYEETIKQCGEFIPIMQYLMAYTLGYYFTENVVILNKEEHQQYDAVRKMILSHIEDCYLKEIPNTNFMVKWKILSFKYNLGFEKEINQWHQNEQKAQWNLMRAARTISNYNTLKRWFALKQQNKKICTYFERNGYNRIAIYGMSDLGVYLLEELENSSIEVVCGIDRRAEKMEIGIPLLKVEDFFPGVDAVIVTAVFFFKEVDELLRTKVTCPVISLEDVLYTIE